MDTKRLIIAIALSMVVIIAYQYLFMPAPKKALPKPGETGTGQPLEKSSTTAEPSQEPSNQPIDYSSIHKQKKKIETPTETEITTTIQNDLVAEKEQLVTIETDLFIATFMNKGAGLKSFVMKKYNDDKNKEPMDLISRKVDDINYYPFYFSPFETDETLDSTYEKLNSENYVFDGPTQITLSASETNELVFRYQNVEKQLSVVKKFRFANNSYVIGIEYEVFINGKPVKDAPIIFGPDLENNVNHSRVMQAPLRLGTYDGQDVKETIFASVKREKTEVNKEIIEFAENPAGSNFYWVTYDTTYFAAIFQTHEPIRYWIMQKEMLIQPDSINPDPKQPAETSTNPENPEKTPVATKETPKTEKRLYSYIIVSNPRLVYLGPKNEDILAGVEKAYGIMNVSEVVDYGWGFIGGIASLMLKAIKMIHNIIPNWGWALVIFTLIIKILLFPLTYTSMVSMAKMQTLQPKIKALKKKYKNLRDPEQRKAMQIEQMALFKSEKVNPAGGCLPMLLQMPILFAFFRLLPISINFRHEPWVFWLTDLSVKDPIYLLPILMGVTQIIVSKMSPTTSEGGQKKLMYIMPVVMVFLFMNYSAGLNLYWFISNLIQIGQQKLINERIFKQKKDEDKERKALKRKKGVKTT